MQERPQCKALAPVFLKAEIDPAVLDAGCKGVGSNSGEVGGGKVALQQINLDADDEGPLRSRERCPTGLDDRPR